MVSDFLIETEGEMKKVSWPTRAEVVGSSVVVIATVMVLGVYMYIVDFGLDRLRAVLRGVLS
ncbi:MAG: preprotein translocase subunit SecE [Planctomycetes bacterium]|nr:preprotein translocase subunit SecE [Planctomycetota bacterium]